VAAGFAVLDSPLLALPGEGLLPAELEGGAAPRPGGGGPGGGGGGGVLGAVLGLME
jgi:hypothetical protein